jgi:arginine-tRNA-protein transferase
LLLYKPDLGASCCPQYTIRLDSEAFCASKEQRQALNRFNKHILGETYIKEAARLYPKSRDQAKKRNTDFDLVERVHEGERAHLPTPPEPTHILSVTLESNDFTEEKYSLFENYQRVVHREPPRRISRHGFKSFLCSSPLPRKRESFNGRERRLGSYHQCYRIDGELVAMGVLDLLPQCVSAVYFIYHESVHQHSLGKLGALREIALAKEEGYRWWYAGFYIHSCAKMRYKADYTPQFILDPKSYTWYPLDDDLKKKLNESEHVLVNLPRESPDMKSVEETRSSTIPIETRDDEKVTSGDEDSDEDLPVPDPDLPLFKRPMPGVLTRDQLLNEIDLDHIKIRIQGHDAETCHLNDWESSSMDNPYSIKGAIADLVAAVGVELGKEMVVSFSSRSWQW